MPSLRQLLASSYNDGITLEWQSLHLPSLVQQALSTPFAPLLYHLIHSRLPSVLETAELRALRQRYIEIGLLNSFLLGQLREILPAFGRANVPILLLKGSAFASHLYGNIALRPMSDLDLLIPFEHYQKAVSLLQDLHFAPPNPFPFPNRAGWYWNECAMVRPGTPSLTVELHWQLLDIPVYAQRLPESQLRQRAVEIVVEGVPAQTLAPDDHLLHLCAHNLYHHAGQHLFVGLDIAHLLQKYEAILNWERFFQTTRIAQLGLAVKRTLMPALTHWHIPLPDFLRQEIFHLPVHPTEHLWAYAQSSELLKVGRTWLMLPSLSLKADFAWGQLFPTKEYLLWRYGASPFRATLTRFRTGVRHLWRKET